MTVAELIEALKNAPQDADVLYFWDGRARTYASTLYVCKKGVVLSDGDEDCFGGLGEDKPEKRLIG